jgi:S-adenosylmethionine decarboxylase
MAKDSPCEVPAPPFEGAEKLLEIWFAPSIDQVLDAHFAGRRKCGLRKVQRHVWDRMLDVVRCKILSVLEGDEMDLYLLR